MTDAAEGGDQSNRRGFRDLVTWQKALTLTEAVYQLVDEMPETEQWVWEVQLKKACSAITANIAEGYGTGTWPNFRRHVRIARGSAMEVQSQLLSIECVGAAPAEPVDRCCDLASEVVRLTSGLERYLTRQIEAST